MQRIPKRIDGKPVYGFIAVDVTKVAFSHNGLTFAVNPEHSKDIIQDKIRLIERGVTRNRIFDNCRNILDCWLQIHMPSLIVNPPTVVT